MKQLLTLILLLIAHSVTAQAIDYSMFMTSDTQTTPIFTVAPRPVVSYNAIPDLNFYVTPPLLRHNEVERILSRGYFGYLNTQGQLNSTAIINNMINYNHITVNKTYLINQLTRN